jgi:hypothetical protein
MTANDELERMWKEMILAYLSNRWFNNELVQSSWTPTWQLGNLEHEVGAMAIQTWFLVVHEYIYRVFIVQAYQTSQYVVLRGGIFLVQYTRCSLCRLISTWCRAVALFSASGAAL